MWQRARVLAQSEHDAPPAGFLVWVESGPPSLAPGVRYECGTDGVIWPPRPGYRTNVLSPDPNKKNLCLPEVMVQPALVELLPEFCDDPPRIPWGAW